MLWVHIYSLEGRLTYNITIYCLHYYPHSVRSVKTLFLFCTVSFIHVYVKVILRTPVLQCDLDNVPYATRRTGSFRILCT